MSRRTLTTPKPKPFAPEPRRLPPSEVELAQAIERLPGRCDGALADHLLALNARRVTAFGARSNPGRLESAVRAELEARARQAGGVLSIPLGGGGGFAIEIRA